MEASGLVFRQPTCFYGESKFRGGVLPGFYDNGYVQYYHHGRGGGKSGCDVASMAVVRCEKTAVKENKGPMKMKKKKQMKLLKGLSKDLYAFSQMGFGLDSNLDQDLLSQVKGTAISEAADLLMEQLRKIRTEKQLERKRKQEQKKLAKSGAQMRNTNLNFVEMSSSSSESSSDSDCGEVIDMKGLKLAQPKQEESSPPPVRQNDITPSTISPSPFTPTTDITHPTAITSLENSLKGNLETECPSKLEVCMGGKCQKSGAAAILDEFKKTLGIEGAVAECKCMGKCRDGPNVRVRGGEAGDSRIVSPSSNPLFIGVGLEDVDMIVSNFLGENRELPGFAAAN